jgi:hypothetical protein
VNKRGVAEATPLLFGPFVEKNG